MKDISHTLLQVREEIKHEKKLISEATHRLRVANIEAVKMLMEDGAIECLEVKWSMVERRYLR